ncbi:MAG: type II secretion system F family protein [Intrasporangium sp.]|uniref:type II secretion system F family protein n=1 Tax=Intrasporangium sp. TaxID=1925024 RepID=UPI002648D658|nr:type II secretion system F family protein [Intrasporangium sp.]MDN5795018.1 type II secretion system F family protein [Intrasporangium sp.]
MAVLHIGVGLLTLAMLAGTITLVTSSSRSKGVAKSLSLIDQAVGQRNAVRTELDAKDRLVTPVLDRTRRLAVALSPSGTNEQLARKLDQAGNPRPWTVERVMGAKGATLIIGVVLGLVYGGISLRGLLLAPVLGAALFFLPDLLLHNQSLHRREATSKGLADALDMLTVSVEAGQGFDAALMQVARNIEGPISGEFARVLSEIQIGSSRRDAFAAMGDRVALPEVRNFTTALVQADRLGLPIGAVLREQSANMRLIRKQKAEEQAQKVTVKILFPLMLCILPALFVVVIGPGALKMMEMFTSMNG